MKRILLLTAIAATTLTACHKAETTITVNLTDLPEGAVVEIYKFEGRVGDRVFSDTVHNGAFCQTYVCDSFNTETYYDVSVAIGNYYSSRWVYISPNTNSKVSGSDIYSSKWTVASKNPHQRFENDMNDATGEVDVEMRKLEAKLQTTEVTPEERQSLKDKLNSLHAELTDLTFSAMEKLPVDEYWMERFEIMTMPVVHMGTAYRKYAQLVELYNRMSEADKATPVGKRITEKMFGKTPSVGDKFTDADLYDVEGNIHHLAEYQGKWMLLEFSSINCGPCRNFTLVTNYLYEIGVGQNLEFITLTEDPQEAFEEMAAADKPAGPFWNNRDRTLFPTYKISTMPTFYLISPDGIITDTWNLLDLQRAVNAIITAGAFPKPEFKTANGATIITNPAFTSSNHAILVEGVELYADSTVLYCTHPSTISFTIKPETCLSANDKEIKILKSNTGRDKINWSRSGGIGRYRITFGSLPKNTTEFNFIQSNSPKDFRVLGIKIKE